MPSTAKIVLTIIAFYLVVGIYNYSGSGSFITPFFLNYFFFCGLAIYSYVLYYKSSNSSILGLYALAIVVLASSHSITLTFLNRLIPFSNRTTVTADETHKVLAILVFYCLLLVIHMKAKKDHNDAGWFWLPFILLLGSLVAVLLNENMWQALLLSTYFLSFTILSNRLNNNDLQSYRALTFQFVLFLILENIRFLSSGF